MVEWKNVINSKKDGAMGIRSLKKQNKCLLLKWLWTFTKEEHTLWATVIKAKYGKEDY